MASILGVRVLRFAVLRWIDCLGAKAAAFRESARKWHHVTSSNMVKSGEPSKNITNDELHLYCYHAIARGGHRN